jgi:hypothetical protein
MHPVDSPYKPDNEEFIVMTPEMSLSCEFPVFLNFLSFKIFLVEQYTYFEIYLDHLLAYMLYEYVTITKQANFLQLHGRPAQVAARESIFWRNWTPTRYWRLIVWALTHKVQDVLRS